MKRLIYVLILTFFLPKFAGNSLAYESLQEAKKAVYIPQYYRYSGGSNIGTKNYIEDAYESCSINRQRRYDNRVVIRRRRFILPAYSFRATVKNDELRKEYTVDFNAESKILKIKGYLAWSPAAAFHYDYNAENGQIDKYDYTNIHTYRPGDPEYAAVKEGLKGLVNDAIELIKNGTDPEEGTLQDFYKAQAILT